MATSGLSKRCISACFFNQHFGKLNNKSHQLYKVLYKSHLSTYLYIERLLYIERGTSVM